MKRIFAAIKVHPSEALVSLIYQLKHALRNENIKWVEPQNIHITLKFFGETKDDKIIEINHHLDGIAKKHKPFKFQISGTGVFGSSYQPRVIWLGISENPELKNLATDVLDSMSMIGWERDRQNFIPHLTAARIKYISNKAKLREVVDRNKSTEIQEVMVNEFYLYESILRPQGPIYHILETFELSETFKRTSSKEGKLSDDYR